MSVKVESTTDSPEEVSRAMVSPTGDDASVESKSDEAASTQDEEHDETSDEESESETDEATDDEESDESDESDEDEDSDEEADDDGEKKPEKGRRYRSRVKRLSRKLSEKDEAIQEARDKAEYWKQKALEKSKAKDDDDSEETEAKSAKAKAADRPDPDDFEEYEDYIEALTDWKVDLKNKENSDKYEAQQIQKAHSKKSEALIDNIQEFKKSHDDFDSLMEDIDDIPLSMTVEQTILDSENGPELMYELAKDADNLERICGLSPISAARELGKLEAKIEMKSSGAKKEAKPKPKTSKAPEPINPARGKKGGSAKSIYDADKMSQAEFERARNKELANQGAW